MPIQKDLLEGLKIGNTDKDFQKRIFLKNDLQKVVEFKNAIPRF
jgi:hypothetical protein